MRGGLLEVATVAVVLAGCAGRHAPGTTPQASQAAPVTQAAADSAVRKTIFIPPMDGYEKNVAGTFRVGQVPVDIVTDKGKAELQVRATFSKGDGIGDVLSKKRTGHAPFSWLDVVEVETGRTLVSYPFLWTDYEVSRDRDAQEFARELKKKLAGKAKKSQ